MTASKPRALRVRSTDAERTLWTLLRNRQLGGHKFRRQHPIGPYVVDFAGLARRLVVELDGGQHAMAKDKDDERTRWLESQGYRIVRFWNHDVLENTDGVLQALSTALD
jgi:very-short-patch-repair endonuclease